MKISRWISVLLIACLGVASTGAVTVRYVCSGKKTVSCDNCRTMKSGSCCKRVVDYSKVDAVGKIAIPPRHQLIPAGYSLPPVVVFAVVPPVQSVLNSGPPRPPDMLREVQTISLRI